MDEMCGARAHIERKSSEQQLPEEIRETKKGKGIAVCSIGIGHRNRLFIGAAVGDSCKKRLELNVSVAKESLHQTGINSCLYS